MNADDTRKIIIATGEEICDEHGTVIGYIEQPARFKLQKSYLALGGFLVVVRVEESGDYVGTEFDALPHPKTGEPYPAGHSEVVWRTPLVEEALQHVLAALAPDVVQ